MKTQIESISIKTTLINDRSKAVHFMVSKLVCMQNAHTDVKTYKEKVM
jgi:hypothetical protein